MLKYIYFVKCPNCEDEHFDFFNDAKDFALGCLSKKPIITQTEVNRNDFGECTDSCDLGTVWSWEDMMDRETDDEPAKSVFTKDNLKPMINATDHEFDNIDNSLDFNSVEDAIDFLVKDEEEAITGYEKVEDAVKGFGLENKKEILDTIYHIKEEEVEHIEELEALININEDKIELVDTKQERKPVPADKSIEDLVEEMEENEDEVECRWCDELFDKSECRYEVDLGWLCDRCQAAIKSRGEELTFRENYCGNSLDESVSSSKEVDFKYNDLEVTLLGRQRDVDDWDEETLTVDFTYTRTKDDVATAIWENFITEDDVTDVPGGLAALEDDSAWEEFLETHFDTLFEKYYDKLLDFYRQAATEACEETPLEDYYRDLAAHQDDDAYERQRDARYFADFDESCPRQSINETIDSKDLVELEYPRLTVTLYGPKRDVDDWDELEHTDSFVYLVPKDDVAAAIWDNWITEEDAKDVEGGLETLEDDKVWESFLEAHFDDLFEKYNKQILNYFEDEATEDFRERSQEEYGLDRWSADEDRAYDAWRDEKYFGESFDEVKPFLAESDESPKADRQLVDCPECGVSESFDHAAGTCTNCGFHI